MLFIMSSDIINIAAKLVEAIGKSQLNEKCQTQMITHLYLAFCFVYEDSVTKRF